MLPLFYIHSRNKMPYQPIPDSDDAEDEIGDDDTTGSSVAVEAWIILSDLIFKLTIRVQSINSKNW